MSHRVPRSVPAATAIALLCATAACGSGGRKQASNQTATPLYAAADTGRPLDTRGKRLEDLFAGKFPGVSVTPADGGGLRIRIRGGSNTFYGTNEPLYIVDETPLPGNTGGIVFLAPADIERIEVLKNPADTGVYGIRGSNGVVKITTKRPPGARRR